MGDIGPPPTLEVVICTYNNAPMLADALAALARQRPLDAGRWGCLVVDNNCTDATASLVEKHIGDGTIPGLRVVREPRQGLTPSRLCGVRSSVAPWIAFVDDDCILESDWIVQAVSFAESHPDVGAFGGTVALDFCADAPAYARAYGYSFAEQNHGDVRQRAAFLVGAGLVVSRAALSSCGWTAEPVLPDRIGRRLVSGGDVEIVLRIASAGYELWYVPDCRLRHRIPPQRTSLRYLAAINRGLGVSQALADAMVWSGSSAGWVRTSSLKLMKDVGALCSIARAVLGGRATTADLRIQANFRLGQLRGLVRIASMSPSRRRRLMGLARPRHGRKDRAAWISLPWNVVHVSLRDPLPDLELDPTVGGLLLVFWWDRLPLGQLSLPASLLPVSSDQLLTSVASIIAPAVGQRLLKRGFDAPLPVPADRQPRRAPPLLSEVLALDRPLTSLSRSACDETSTAIGPTVSVVVCTRNRPEHLERCLVSLSALDPAPHEILVVDNDPSSGVTQRVTDRFQAVRYVAEPRAGLSIARNRGVLSCTGEIVAFTDDDVQVHPGWLDAIRSEFRNEDVMVLTGLVLPAELKTPAQQAFQSDALGWGWGYRALDFDEAFFEASKSVGVPVWRIGAGANMAFRREVFDRLGLFEERLGAGASGCSEDSELWYRVLAGRERCRYSPAAVVFHHHRPDWSGLSEQLYSYMRGHVVALFVQFERYRHWGNLYRAFLALPWFLLRIALHAGKRQIGKLLYGRAAKPLPQPVTPQILGALAGYSYYLRHRRRHSNGDGGSRGTREQISAG